MMRRMILDFFIIVHPQVPHLLLKCQYDGMYITPTLGSTFLHPTDTVVSFSKATKLDLIFTYSVDK